MENLTYDPKTGLFSRLRGKRPGHKRKDGYIEIRVEGKKELAHRLAWFMFYGNYPEAGVYVDHINRVRDDNRICNLRLLSPKDSQWNRTDRFADGVMYGVRQRGKRWEAYTTRDKKQVYLGMFDTAGIALEARRRAEEAHWGYGVAWR